MSSGNSKRPQSRKGSGRAATSNRSGSRSAGSAPTRTQTRPAGGSRSTGWSASEHGRRDQQRQRLVVAGIAVGVVVVLVVALVLVKTLGGSDSGTKISASDSSKAITTATSVPASVLDSVGPGTYTYEANKVGLQAVTGTPIQVGSKPAVVYLGAEFCPYCAAQRWPLVVALSRFGKFSGLKTTTSAGKPEVHPDTPTFTFLDAKYTSSYIDLQTAELSDRNHNALQTPTSTQTKLFNTYDPDGSIPFVYYGGKYFSIGATMDQDPLDGKSLTEIANALKDPNNKIATSIDGAANVITAGICQSTGGQPGAVCNAAGVKSAAKKLPGSGNASS